MVDLTVVIAVKDEIKYISDCIESIINQELTNYEVIVVDDHSKDGTLEYLKKIEVKTEKLKVYLNDKIGKVEAFNYGIKISKGNWICLFAGDDIMPKGSLKNRYNYVKNLSSRDLQCVSISKLKTMSSIKRFDSIVLPKKKGRGNFSGQCYLMSKKIINILFPIPGELPNEDTWIHAYLQYASGVKIIHNEVICCHYRIHEGNSIRRDMNFNEFNDKLHIRNQAYQLIIKKLNNHFNNASLKKISDIIALENLRHKGKSYSILSHASHLEQKIRYFINSNKITYYLKMRFFNFFVGW